MLNLTRNLNGNCQKEQKNQLKKIKAMNKLLFIKLSEKVKNCNHKEIKDFGFDGEDFSNAEFQSAWFEIHTMPYVENYNVIIRENGKIYLTQGDANICPITGEDAKKWQELANDFFQCHFQEQIEEAQKEDSYNSWLDYQDTRGELQRHGW